MKQIIICFFIAGSSLLFSCGSGNKEKTNTTEKSSTPLTGEENYKKHCAMCHGADGNMGVGGAKKIPASILDQPQREQLILNGKGTMPAFKDKMDSEEIKKVAEYTLTLK